MKNERPLREHYGPNEDLAFQRDLNTWHYSEIEYLREVIRDVSNSPHIPPVERRILKESLTDSGVHEPKVGDSFPENELEQPVATPGATFPGEDSVSLSAESSRPRELLAQQMEPDTSPLTHQEIFSAIHSLAADIVRLTAAVPAQCTQGASRDASSEKAVK